MYFLHLDFQLKFEPQCNADTDHRSDSKKGFIVKDLDDIDPKLKRGRGGEVRWQDLGNFCCWRSGGNVFSGRNLS